MAGTPQRFAVEDLVADARCAAVEAAASGGGAEIECGATTRLPARALAALATLGGSCRLLNASPEARLALAVLGYDRFLAENQRGQAPAAAGTAFVARADGTAIAIEIDRKAGDDGRLAHAQSHRWMAGVAAERVLVDFAKVEHVNSSIVAWLLLLVQAARPARFELRKVHRQVQAQLTQLRLNHLLTVKDS